MIFNKKAGKHTQCLTDCWIESGNVVHERDTLFCLSALVVFNVNVLCSTYTQPIYHRLNLLLCQAMPPSRCHAFTCCPMSHTTQMMPHAWHADFMPSCCFQPTRTHTFGESLCIDYFNWFNEKVVQISATWEHLTVWRHADGMGSQWWLERNVWGMQVTWGQCMRDVNWHSLHANYPMIVLFGKCSAIIQDCAPSPQPSSITFSPDSVK